VELRATPPLRVIGKPLSDSSLIPYVLTATTGLLQPSAFSSDFHLHSQFHDSVGRGSVSQFSRGPAIVVLLGASRLPEIHLDSPARARDRKRVPRFPLGARVPACRFERISLDSRWSNRVLQRSSSLVLSWSVPFGCLWCVFNVCGLHHPWYSRNALPRLPKVRWFSGFPPLNEKKDQATSGSYQNATEPNQFNRHTYPLHL